MEVLKRGGVPSAGPRNFGVIGKMYDPCQEFNNPIQGFKSFGSRFGLSFDVKPLKLKVQKALKPRFTEAEDAEFPKFPDRLSSGGGCEAKGLVGFSGSVHS